MKHFDITNTNTKRQRVDLPQCPRIHSLALRACIERRVGARGRRGVTLLEVMLAIAILGMSLASIGELIRLGVTGSLRTRDLTRAQIYAESKMSEITTGVYPIQSSAVTPYEADPTYIYQVEVQPALQAGMLHVAVHVEKDTSQGGEPVYFELFRWVVDPEAEAALEEENQRILDESTQGESTEDTGGL